MAHCTRSDETGLFLNADAGSLRKPVRPAKPLATTKCICGRLAAASGPIVAPIHAIAVDARLGQERHIDGCRRSPKQRNLQPLDTIAGEQVRSIERKRRSVAADCRLQLAHLLVHLGTDSVANREIRAQPDCFIVVRDSMFIIALVPIGATAVPLNTFRVLCIEPQSLAVISDGPVIVALRGLSVVISPEAMVQRQLAVLAG